MNYSNCGTMQLVVLFLLNTSFNLKGEPIVETPNDAIRTFYSSGLDCLLEKLHNSKIIESPLYMIFNYHL